MIMRLVMDKLIKELNSEIEEFNMLHSMIETKMVDLIFDEDSGDVKFSTLEKVQRANAMMKFAVSALDW